MGHIKILVESQKSDIINFWDTILNLQGHFHKTSILKSEESGIKTIQQSPILNTMHVSDKGHLHNKRYGPYKNFGRVTKIGHYQFLGHHFESSGPFSQNVYPEI